MFHWAIFRMVDLTGWGAALLCSRRWQGAAHTLPIMGADMVLSDSSLVPRGALRKVLCLLAHVLLNC